MQTFLPYPNYIQSARVLDRQRLGKQRVEVLQILRAIHRPNYGWKNHPIVKMWEGYTNSLIIYGVAMCEEFMRRGYNSRVQANMREYYDDTCSLIKPPWIGNEAFHLSHQSNLIRKKPEHYSKFWPDVPADLPYVWFERNQNADFIAT